MTPALTDADREAIDACYVIQGWDNKHVGMCAEYHLCEAAYLAGLAAGMERAAKLMDTEIGPGCRAAAAIRAAKRGKNSQELSCI